jgi:farnesyl diphosphate synthase
MTTNDRAAVAVATTDLAGWMQAHQDRIERVLAALLPDPAIAPSRLHEAMRYAVLGGGKRVRPLLAYAAGEAVGADPARVDRVAAAVELIHAYSLVHDDLPCMDDDVLRRGRPTVHVQYDEATAMLVGDSLQSLAFEVITDGTIADDPRVERQMVGMLARASGSRGMAGGQAVDLDSQGKTLSVPELEFMHGHKTGALILVAVLLGARCGVPSESEIAGLGRYAKFIGLAFQVVDDILDATASTETLGKTAGKDADADKATFVSAMGISRAKGFADELLADALGSLDVVAERGERLRQIARYVVARDR